MTEDEKRDIEKFVGDTQAMTVSAVAQAMAIVLARLAWHLGSHEKLRADLRTFLRDFAPDRPEDATSVRMHAMMDAILRQSLLRLSEIPDLENPPPDD